MAMIRKMIYENEALTEEQIKQTEEADKRPIFFDDDYERFRSLAHIVGSSRQKELAAIALKDSVMRIKAKLTIPSVIKNFGINEQDFLASCTDLPDEDKDLYFRCYYGSFMIVKK